MEEVQVMKTGLSRLVAGAGVAALVAGIAVYSQSNVEAATADVELHGVGVGDRQLHDLGRCAGVRFV